LWKKWDINILKYVGKDLDPGILFAPNPSFTPVRRMESSNIMMAYSLEYPTVTSREPVGKRRSQEKQRANVTWQLR